MTASIAPPRRKLRFPTYVLAVPSMVWYAAFFIAPIAFIVFYSFGAKDTTQRVPVDLGSLSLHNYSEAFDDTFFKTFKSTIRIASSRPRCASSSACRSPTSSPSRCARSGGRSCWR